MALKQTNRVVARRRPTLANVVGYTQQATHKRSSSLSWRKSLLLAAPYTSARPPHEIMARRGAFGISHDDKPRPPFHIQLTHPTTPRPLSRRPARASGGWPGRWQPLGARALRRRLPPGLHRLARQEAEKDGEERAGVLLPARGRDQGACVRAGVRAHGCFAWFCLKNRLWSSRLYPFIHRQ